MLFGMDEDSYFGVKLADNPNTVNEAFKSLMPKEVCNKKHWKRQGEWFALPIDVEKLPKITEIAAEYLGANNFIVIQKIVLNIT
jgi:hypothetical protein